MPRLQQSQVQEQQKSPGLLSFLRPFITAGASALGGPMAGAAAGFLTGDVAGGTKSAVSAMQSGGEDPTKPKQEDPNKVEVHDPNIKDQNMNQMAPMGGGQQGGAGGGGMSVPFDPQQQQAEQERTFAMLEQALPELPVFLTQNPDFFPGALGFLSEAQKRYTPKNNLA